MLPGSRLHPAYRVLFTATGGDFYYLGTNVQAAPLADETCAAALGYALNRQRLVDGRCSGFGRRASIQCHGTRWCMMPCSTRPTPTIPPTLGSCWSAIQRLNSPRASRPLRQGSIRWSVVDQPGVHEPQPATYFVRAPPVRISNVSNFSTQEYQEFISMSLAATDGEQLRSDFQSLTKILFDEAFVLVIGEADDLPCV